MHAHTRARAHTQRAHASTLAAGRSGVVAKMQGGGGAQSMSTLCPRARTHARLVRARRHADDALVHGACVRAETIRKSKDASVEEIQDEDLELVQNLLETFSALRVKPPPRATAKAQQAAQGQCKPKRGGAAGGGAGRPSKEKVAVAGGGRQKKGGRGEEEGTSAAGGDGPAKKAKTRGSVGGGGAGAGSSSSRGGGSRLRLSEEDMIQQAIALSMQDA